MTATIRNRIKCHRRVRAGDLVPHELNFRLHPEHQKAAFQVASVRGHRLKSEAFPAGLRRPDEFLSLIPISELTDIMPSGGLCRGAPSIDNRDVPILSQPFIFPPGARSPS